MVLLLESISPMNFLGSQALRVLSPVIDCVGHTEDVDRIARVLEKRDGIQQLITLIEAKSGAMSLHCSSPQWITSIPSSSRIAAVRRQRAILIERKGGGYRQTFRGEAPTTVEAPFEDVTRGVLNAIAELEEISGRSILDGERLRKPSKRNIGVDMYLSTSSAGGGLQMMVAGAVKNMTGESAQRCALGAGAIVMDTPCLE